MEGKTLFDVVNFNMLKKCTLVKHTMIFENSD